MFGGAKRRGREWRLEREDSRVDWKVVWSVRRALKSFLRVFRVDRWPCRDEEEGGLVMGGGGRKVGDMGGLSVMSWIFWIVS